MPQNSNASRSSTRAGASFRSSSGSDRLREYKASDPIGRTDPTQRFFVTGVSTRTGDSMAREMRKWDDKWTEASRRR